MRFTLDEAGIKIETGRDDIHFSIDGATITADDIYSTIKKLELATGTLDELFKMVEDFAAKTESEAERDILLGILDLHREALKVIKDD